MRCANGLRQIKGNAGRGKELKLVMENARKREHTREMRGKGRMRRGKNYEVCEWTETNKGNAGRGKELKLRMENARKREYTRRK